MKIVLRHVEHIATDYELEVPDGTEEGDMLAEVHKSNQENWIEVSGPETIDGTYEIVTELYKDK